MTRYVPSVTPISAFCAEVGAKVDVRSVVVTRDELAGAVDFSSESTLQALEATTMPPPRSSCGNAEALGEFHWTIPVGPHHPN